MPKVSQKNLSYFDLLNFELRRLVLSAFPASTDIDHIAGHPGVEAFAIRWGVKPRGVAGAIIAKRKEAAND